MLKKTTFFLFTAVILLMFATACKKDSKSTQELILGKWNFHSYDWHEIDGTSDTEGTEDMSATGYHIDFRADGNVYMYMFNNYDTVDYKVISNQTIILGGDTTQISTLTDNSLTVYYKETGTDYLYEEWANFKK